MFAIVFEMKDSKEEWFPVFVGFLEGETNHDFYKYPDVENFLRISEYSFESKEEFDTVRKEWKNRFNPDVEKEQDDQ